MSIQNCMLGPRGVDREPSAKRQRTEGGAAVREAGSLDNISLDTFSRIFPDLSARDVAALASTSKSLRLKCDALAKEILRRFYAAPELADQVVQFPEYWKERSAVEVYGRICRGAERMVQSCREIGIFESSRLSRYTESKEVVQNPGLFSDLVDDYRRACISSLL